MNDNARKWVEALRSDEFKQGRRRLRVADDRTGIGAPDGDYFCCLGVACELYRRETGAGQWRGSGYFVLSAVEESNIDLPLTVARWLGLASETGRYVYAREHFLTGENDAGRTFDEIAAIIEREPPGLFGEPVA